MSGADREPVHRPAVGLLLTGGVAAALVTAMVTIPREHAPLPAVARYAMEVALPRWKLTEPVNEIVYGTRGFDTFGETFLLLAAVVSVVVLARHREPRLGYFGEETAGRGEQRSIDPREPATLAQRQARSAEKAESEEGTRRTKRDPDQSGLGKQDVETAEQMTVVVRVAVRVVLPVLAIAGFYLAAWGFSPGGGFPGGAVLLGVLLLVYAAYGHRRVARVVRPGLLEALEMAGAAGIILTEALGLVFNGSFSGNWLPLTAPGTIRSGGMIQLFSAGELIEVATGLAIAVFALLGMGHDWTPDEEGGEDDRADGGESS